MRNTPTSPSDRYISVTEDDDAPQDHEGRSALTVAKKARRHADHSQVRRVSSAMEERKQRTSLRYAAHTDTSREGPMTRSEAFEHYKRLGMLDVFFAMFR